MPESPGQFAGDAPVGFTDVVADPSTPGTLYAANPAGGGLYKSTNAGVNWTAMNQGLSVAGAIPAVDTVAVDPNDASVVLVGTAGNGLFVSRDGGSTWSPSGSGVVGAVIDSIAFSRESSTVIVGTHGDGVFRSTDLGATWSSSNPGFDASLVTAVVADPQTAGPGSGRFLRRHPHHFRRRLQLERSDGNLRTGLVAGVRRRRGAPRGDDRRRPLREQGRRNELGRERRRPQRPGHRRGGRGPDESRLTVYAGTAHPYDGTNSERVYKSTDGGANWTQTSLDAQDATIFGITVNPSKPAQVAAVSPGTLVYFQSNDGGANWSTITPNPTCGSVNASSTTTPRRRPRRRRRRGLPQHRCRK